MNIEPSSEIMNGISLQKDGSKEVGWHQTLFFVKNELNNDANDSFNHNRVFCALNGGVCCRFSFG